MSDTFDGAGGDSTQGEPAQQAEPVSSTPDNSTPESSAPEGSAPESSATDSTTGSVPAGIDTSSSAPAGWYPDPQSGAMRYWDGSAWGAFQSGVVPPPPGYSYPAPANKYSPPDAVTMFVVSILSFFVCPFLGIWSFNLSRKAKAEAARVGMEPDWQVTASYIISIITLVCSVFWLLMMVLVFVPLLFLPFLPAS